MPTGRVFVSATSDLAHWPAGRSFAQAAADAVHRAGRLPADTDVRDCDSYIAVVGFHYGAVVPGPALSATELEFAEAGAAGLPRLVFLLADAVQVPPDVTDADRSAADAFRQRLRAAGLTVREFTSADHLELEVFHALTGLGGDALPAVPETAASVCYSLPSDTGVFTGRDHEVDLIISAVTDAADRGVLIRAIDGMPGLGKTALAIHAAHLVRPQFPDRQLFIDLHGHTPGQPPVTPEVALANLLAAVGVDARSLPADLEGRKALWRDRMAGQRTLLVLDNAASSQQVAPLLPGDGNSLVLVTSRRHLGDLPGVVVPVMLDALRPGEAAEMFRRLAPHAAQDPAAAAVQQLVQLAGFLPLAISLLARVYLRHPSWTIADLIGETEASVLTLTAEAGSIEAAFGVSYRTLTAGQQGFFRVLGLHPGTTIDAYAAAALAGLPVPEAAGLLDALHGEGLLTEPGYRRYGMHDLIRAYARHCIAEAAVSGADQMLARLLDYYQHTASLAEACLSRQTQAQPAQAPAAPSAAPELADRRRALAWLRAERVNLLACLDHATCACDHARVVAFTSAAAALLRQDGAWVSAITHHQTAVRSARQLGDQPGEASALIELGTLLQLTGAVPGAAAVLGQALDIYRALGDRLGQANALASLGEVWRRMDDYPGASAALGAALDIYRALGDRLGQANALNELGAVLSVTSDFPGAAGALGEALGLYRDLGDQAGEADNLYRLGVVRRHTGDYPAATVTLEAALRACRGLGDRLGEANTLNHLGAVRRDMADYRGAVAALVEAARIHRDLGNQSGRAVALTYLGTVCRLTGDWLGAEQALTEALGAFRDIGHRSGEVEVLNELGTLHRVHGGVAEAVRCHRAALQVAQEIDSAWDEAHALAGLGRCDLAAGHPAAAEARLRQAYQMFQRIGAAETPGVAAELDALAGEQAV